jgi:hypothetical protein
VKLGHVALDGPKIKAKASKHKAMSYERMEKRAAELEAEVGKWLEAAEATDAEEESGTAPTRPARRCRVGSPTRSSALSAFAEPRLNWRQRRRLRPKPSLKRRLRARQYAGKP